MESQAVQGGAPAGMLEKRFGQYIILEHLGTGGMGDVYKAVHVGLDRPVALKILPPQLARSEGYSERFFAEAYAISRLQHQNIVTLYDYGEESGQKFIAMQFIQGMTLSRLVRSQYPLDYGRVINLTKQICRGLKYAHAADVVHRDIKSGNIMVEAGDKAYISDFGIAKVVDSPSLTTAGMALGTPEYMAPEQCEGGVVDAQSDLYSLGAVLFEMLTGEPPFRAETPLAVAFKQVHETPPLLGKVRSGLPPRLELIVAKCLKKKKEERYRSADELLHDLDTVHVSTAGLLTKAAAEPEQRITDRREGERRWSGESASPRPLLIGALALLAVTTGLLVWQTLTLRKRPDTLTWLRPVRTQGLSGVDAAGSPLAEANLWDGNRKTYWSPAQPSGTLTLDLGSDCALQALYLETGMPAGPGEASGFPTAVEVNLDGQKPLRYPLEGTGAPQTLLLQGRVAHSLTLRFLTRGNALPKVRELRVLGLRYE